MIWTFHSIYIWKVGLKPLPYYEIVLLITPVFGTAVFPICHNFPNVCRCAQIGRLINTSVARS